MNVWFYRFNDELAKRHRTAYEKSLTSEHAIRVHKGSYYYKGYEIDWGEERARNYQWRYRKVEEYPEDNEFVRTKAECIADIDGLIEWEQKHR